MRYAMWMKAVVFCVLVALTQGCFSHKTSLSSMKPSTMPADLLAFLNNSVDSVFQCETTEIVDITYQERENHDLLVFMHLPDYLCTRSNSVIPVIVSPEGRWTWGNRLSGLPSLCVEDKDRVLWLITQWAVEGSYPELYRSSDGITWTSIPLPENRQVDCCFEFVREICFYRDRVRLRFEGGDTDGTGSVIRYWSMKKSGQQTPALWQSVDTARVARQACESRKPDPGGWVLADRGAEYVLSNSLENRIVIFPKTLAPVPNHSPGSP